MKKFFNKKTTWFLVKTAFSSMLLLWLFTKVDRSLVSQLFKEMNHRVFVVGGGFYLLNAFLYSWRSGVVLKLFNISVQKMGLLKLTFNSTFYSNFLPGTVGGDGYKFLALSHVFPEKKIQIFNALILDRLSGLLTLLFFNIISGLFFIDVILSSSGLLMTEGIIFLSIFTAWFLWWGGRFLYLKFGRLFGDWSKKITSVLQTLLQIKIKPVVIPLVISSTAIVFVGAFWQWFYLRSLGAEVSLMFLILAFTITQIAGLLPISFNSLGLTEGIMVYCLGLVGIPLEVVLLATLGQRFTLVLGSVLGWIVGGVFKKFFQL